MDYVRRIPAPPLNAYIDDLYYIDGVPPYPRLKVSPMPSLHLMVNMGSAFHVYTTESSAPYATCTESWWMGLWNTYYTIDYPLPVQFYGVHFKPSGVYPFLRLPISELRNQIVPVDTLWGHFAAEMRERLYSASSAQAGLALLEQLLLARFCETLHEVNIVQYAIGQIARHHGALSIRGLSDQIGISDNHLGTQFKRVVGVSPKELARFYRFARVVLSIDATQPVDWTRLARNAGFYDLSHLNKDFLAFTGHNPTDYLLLRYRFNSEKPGHVLDVAPLLPID